MVAVLDILQSIPVLSFLPPVVLAMVSLIPGHQLGIEMGGHPAHLYRAGVESRIQLLFVAQNHSARDAGGLAHLSLFRLAAVLAAGDAILHHRPGVELDRLRGGRLVRAHLLRDLHHGRSQLPAARPGQLHPDRNLRRRCPRTACRHRDRDRDRRCHRSACLASADRLERQVQIRAGGICRPGQIADPRSSAPVEDLANASRPHLEPRGRACLPAPGAQQGMPRDQAA